MKFKVKGFNHYTCAPWRRTPYHPRSEAEWDHGPRSEAEWEDGVHLRCNRSAGEDTKLHEGNRIL